MLLYKPFQNENGFFPEEEEKCIALYNTFKIGIEWVKNKILPFVTKVQDAREFADGMMSNIADQMDPENELFGDEDETIGVLVDPEHYLKNPEGILEENYPNIQKEKYRKIEFDSDEKLLDKICNLDREQRMAFEVGVKYGRDYVKASKKPDNKWPDPPLLLVHGGAGTGKSHVIDVLSQTLEKIFRKSGDKPDEPYILKLAFTGSAAKIINGQTLHSVFHFSFNDTIMSVSNKQRDKMRTNLKNLKLIIIDEISLVKAEMMYQLHFRLSKEIFQNKKPFGGVSIFAFGDILQIKPVKGSFVFEKVKNEEMRLTQLVEDLWRKFQPVILKTNHRQGEDKVYADILNNVRIGAQTAEDMKCLKDRIFHYNSAEVPKDALVVTGTNKKVDKYNTENLNKQKGTLMTFEAIVNNANREKFIPKLKYGTIVGTPLQYEIKLKVGSRIMLTTNFDVCDG